MKIQKIIYLDKKLPVDEGLKKLISDYQQEIRLFRQWQGLNPQYFIERAASRDQNLNFAYRLEAYFPDTHFETMIPDFKAKDAKTIFIGTALEFGWDPVPTRDEIAYLYAEFSGRELKSVFKFYGSIRHYNLRSQLMPNLVRCTRVVVLGPEIIPLFEEIYTIFPQRCYVLSNVIERVAGKIEDIETIAALNGIEINQWEDYIRFMEKVAGNKIILSHGTFQLDPIIWPVYGS